MCARVCVLLPLLLMLLLMLLPLLLVVSSGQSNTDEISCACETLGEDRVLQGTTALASALVRVHLQTEAGLREACQDSEDVDRVRTGLHRLALMLPQLRPVDTRGNCLCVSDCNTITHLTHNPIKPPLSPSTTKPSLCSPVTPL